MSAGTKAEQIGLPRCLLKNLLPIWFALSLLGCGSGAAPNGISGGGTPAAPSIASQPAGQSVPMGLTGTFRVLASGSNLQYQWSRNGSPIPGATASTYTTPPTAFADTGTAFTVLVSNSSGSATSSSAVLTITARAPKSGDLRFQQVDAASTVNGYATVPSTPLGCPPPGGGGMSESFPSTTGTGFFLENDPCLAQFSTFSPLAGGPTPDIDYAAVSTQNYQSIMSGTFSGFPNPNDSSSVITSLSLDPSFNAAAIAVTHSSTSSGFNWIQNTVPAAALQALATQAGLQGRVLTALSYDGTQATVFSYSWTGDPNAVYEAKVVFSTVDTATEDIKALAAGGYILTATGCSGAIDGSGVVLVGTRVQGDTTPRPVLVGDVLAGTVDPVFAQGYATVAVITKFQGDTIILKNYIGER